MRIFVTGGTGAIGRHALPALVSEGHEVVALARSRVKADEIRANGATPTDVSIFDRDRLTAAFAGHDAVLNLATALPPTKSAMRVSAWAPCERLRTEGSAAIVDAAITARVPRVLQESVVMIYADGGSTWLDEDAPVDRYPIARGNHAAEASARRFADAGAAVVSGLVAPGGTYNVVDDEPLTKSGYAQAVADAVATRLWLRVPGRLGYLLGDRLTSLTRSVRASNRRFSEATGWRPRYPSAREGYQATVRDA